MKDLLKKVIAAAACISAICAVSAPTYAASVDSVSVTNTFVEGNLYINIYNNGFADYDTVNYITIDNTYIGGDLIIYQYIGGNLVPLSSGALPANEYDFRGAKPMVF